MHLVRGSWAYRTPEELEQAVRSTELHECHGGYFTAYKGIRSDRYSRYNFQYRYMPGETYGAFADCSGGEDSFGLSVWIREGAEEYCGELVIPYKVYYRDVAQVISWNGKICCRI